MTTYTGRLPVGVKLALRRRCLRRLPHYRFDRKALMPMSHRQVAFVTAGLSCLLIVGHSSTAGAAEDTAKAHPGGTARAGSAARGFDLQAHRGGLGLRPESTLSSFGNALRLGVSTLELDIQITEDRQAVVTHDRRVDGRSARTRRPPSPATWSFRTSGSTSRPSPSPR